MIPSPVSGQNKILKPPQLHIKTLKIKNNECGINLMRQVTN